MPELLSTSMTIGARSLPGENRYDVLNPATGKAFASAPICSEIQLEAAAQTALDAFTLWQANETNRRNALTRCCQALRRNAEELAVLITKEQGKPLPQSRSEVAYAANQFEQCAKISLRRTLLSARCQSQTLLLQKPFGVVGLITPWNFPIGTAAVKLAPALRMGNSVILKPSPHAPLSVLRMGQILCGCLPSGVLNTISGGDELGALMAAHPQIRKLSVTGSVATGRSVMREAATNVKSLTLELGGNDPAIVMPDAQPHAIAKPILDAAFRNAGQVCSAIKRVYVHESLFPQLLESLRSAARAYCLGNGMLPQTTMGPLTTLKQLRRLRELASEARRVGGVLHSDAPSQEGDGFFFPPTLVTGIDDDHPLVAEEQFGPLLPVLPYEHVDDVIKRANDSPYGLSASVWTSNSERGYEIASQLECGRVGINGHRRGDVPAPFGGVKQSGIGRELGIWGLLEMSESQVVNFF